MVSILSNHIMQSMVAGGWGGGGWGAMATAGALDSYTGARACYCDGWATINVLLQYCSTAPQQEWRGFTVLALGVHTAVGW